MVARKRLALFMFLRLKKQDLHFTLILFMMGLLLRCCVAILFAREPVWDGHYYDFGAKRIAQGLGYSDDSWIDGKLVWHPWCHYPVGYSGFLAIIYKIFGYGRFQGPLANAFIGALLVIVVHRLSRYGLSPVRSRIAAGLAAFSPVLILFTPLHMTEPLASFGILLAAWIMVRDSKDRMIRGTVGSGIVLGLTILVRPQSILCLPFLPLAICLHDRSRKAFLKYAKSLVISGVFSMLVVLPWTLRNCKVMDGCTFVSTNAGWNLAIGSFPRATGRFETLKSSDGCPIITGQVQQDRCWWNEGVRWIVHDPLRWLLLIPKKLSNTFDHESFVIGYLSETDPKTWTESRKEFLRGVLTFIHRGILTLATLGSISFWNKKENSFPVSMFFVFGSLFYSWVAFMDPFHYFWPLSIALVFFGFLAGRKNLFSNFTHLFCIGLIASSILTHILFFGEDRYHIVLTPAMCILVASIFQRNDHMSSYSKLPTIL